MSTSSENDIRAAFEKLAITHSDINANINISHILEAIDHLKGISHKRLDVDSIFDFITRTTASNITKKALADIITDLVKQNIIVNKKSINGRDSFRRNTEVFSTTDETSDIDNIQLQNEKGQKDNNEPNNSVQQPTHSFIETDIHTLCSSQQLAPENSTDTTSDVSIGDASIKTSTKETLLGILIDSELSFDQHISSICSKASKKLHALGRIASFMSFNKRRTLMKAFIESQFNYCPLIWMFQSRTMNNKINRIHERALRLVYSDHVSSFDELLKKDRSVSIHHRNIQSLAIELYKFLHGLSPSIMKNVFHFNTNIP